MAPTTSSLRKHRDKRCAYHHQQQTTTDTALTSYKFNKWWFFGNIFYPLTIMLFKTSILLLNKRIFVHQGFQRASWVLLVINGCWGIGNFLGVLLECIPIPIVSLQHFDTSYQQTSTDGSMPDVGCYTEHRRGVLQFAWPLDIAGNLGRCD